MKIVLFPQKDEENSTTTPSSDIPRGGWRRFIRVVDREDVAHGAVTSAVVWTLSIWVCALSDFVVPETTNQGVPMEENHLAKEKSADANDASVNQSRTNLTGSGIEDVRLPEATEAIAEPGSPTRVIGRRI